MNIIQSFWSKPYTDTKSKSIHSRFKGGWLTEKAFFISCMLSCLKLKEQYGKVHLITDQIGKSILIDKLKIPYTSWAVELDTLNDFSSELWAIGKIETYRLQKCPFIHFDNDVYLYKPLPRRLIEGDLIIQNFDQDSKYYNDVVEVGLQVINNMPESLNRFLIQEYGKNNTHGCNAGIIGGKDIRFFETYTNFALELARDISNNKKLENFGLVNIFLEQLVYYYLIIKEKKSPIPLLYEVGHEFENVLNFESIPHTQYLHALGKSKKNILTNEQVYMRLELEYPHWFDSISNNYSKYF
ncbi:DUF6734 family protein [Roseivirga pacifica]|uniref:DUF6734 family protein n=1 Tax=Roseivirga pacifica TaxID=1267423 RepID=UPI00227C24F0|nr:DUF6734 family protein [Roseivirga pacifica]